MEVLYVALFITFQSRKRKTGRWLKQFFRCIWITLSASAAKTIPTDCCLRSERCSYMTPGEICGKMGPRTKKHERLPDHRTLQTEFSVILTLSAPIFPLWPLLLWGGVQTTDVSMSIFEACLQTLMSLLFRNSQFFVRSCLTRVSTIS